MKTTLITLAFAAGLVAAQQGVPTCAQPCVGALTSGDSIGGCKALDVKCICEKGSLLDNLACCLEKSCDDAGKEAAVKYALQICGSAGVTNIPTAVVCKAGASSTAADSSASKTAVAAADTTTSEDHSSSTKTDEPTSATTQHTGDHTSGEAATKTESTTSSSTGVAGVLNAPVGMVGAALLGLFAL
ncbi:hypothetical protein NLU13_2157 [Sarocladium strictum]|uniref:CFEM domain-containing protein n=1 Tax=Sarocladium strictum TaxID=5046 RepID=A0AA39GSB9_SARSR|nr:hypothetical protein NLU13_2157 [Sarocladium strictum]